MRVLVTGGAGFIGSHLVERLISDPSLQVVVLDNLRRGSLENLSFANEQVEVRLGDIRRLDDVRTAMAGCEVVFHLAAQANVIGAVQDVEYSVDTNVGGTVNVLRAAEEAGVRRMVFTSSREVYGDAGEIPVSERTPFSAKNAYGASKIAGEMYCRALAGSMEIAVLRLTNVYGTRDHDRVIPIFVESALRNQPLILYGGQQIMDFIPVSTVTGILQRAGFGNLVGEPVNVGSGHGTAVAEVAQAALRAVESASVITIAPARKFEVTRFIADITRAKTLFGLIPPAAPLECLGEVVAWLRARAGVGHPRVFATSGSA